MQIHPFIFSWKGHYDKAIALEKIFLEIFGRVTVINSDEENTPDHWINLGNSAYFAQQFSTACDVFNGDIMFHVQADVSYNNWHAVVEAAKKYYDTYNFGIYAPNIDYTNYTKDRVDISSVNTTDTKIKNVLVTDCSAWFIDSNIITYFNEKCKDAYLKTVYGWGICPCLSAIAFHLNRQVLRDYNFTLDHPKHTNYPTADASILAHTFYNSLDRDIQNVAKRIKNYISQPNGKIYDVFLETKCNSYAKESYSEKIFIQIASYRDPELVPTIRDCIAKAKYPERLTFGICWQRDATESLEEFANDTRFQIIDIPWNESKGLCWARHLIQKLWNKEKYTMQLDSHHRFIQDWDERLIQMMCLTGSEKPILTTYGCVYEPETNKVSQQRPNKMVATRFTDYGTIIFAPHSISDSNLLDGPIPARFVSGHFFFTLGIHCEEYKYDPNLYFVGDEISLSIRSFTLGYDLFHPHYTVVWHEYTRKGRTKHWDDHNIINKENGKIEQEWWSRDIYSKARLRQLLKEQENGIDLGEYGLGTVRSHSDYEFYAGINFKFKKLHPYTKKGYNPPVADTDNWWESLQEKEYNYELEIPRIENFKFIYIGIENKFGEVIFRQDISEWTPIMRVSFKSDTRPYKWVYWPVDLDGKWINRIDTRL